MTENEFYNLLNADASVYGEFKRVGDVEERKGGLSKREHFAAMAMQGQLASLSLQMIDLYVSQAEDERLSGTRQLIAENSVRHADALLKALEK